MIVAKRVVENKPTESKIESNKNKHKKIKKTKQKTPKKEPKSVAISPKVILAVCLSFAVLGLIGAVFCVFLNNFALAKPNIMPPNYAFYIMLALSAISSFCFILQCYKQFNFNVVFTLCSTHILLTLLLLLIFWFNFKYLILTTGILLFISSNALYTTFNKLANKATAPYLFAHLLNLYFAFLSAFIFLVN